MFNYLATAFNLTLRGYDRSNASVPLISKAAHKPTKCEDASIRSSIEALPPSPLTGLLVRDGHMSIPAKFATKSADILSMSNDITGKVDTPFPLLKGA